MTDLPAYPFGASSHDLAAFAHVERLVSGFMVARAVIMGHKLGVFRKLADGPLTMDGLAQALAIHNRRSFGKLIDILGKVELVETSGDRVRNSAVAEASLVPGRPGYYGDFIDFFSRQFVIKSEAKMMSFTRDGMSIDEQAGFEWGEYMGAMVAAAVNRLDQLVAVTSITVKGKPVLTPEKIEYGRDGTSLLFTFPRTSPISLDDKEVEFATKIGAMEVRRKFKLKDMVYQGKLAL